MYGFTHPSLINVLEQLPGAHRCHLYEFKYHREHVASTADDDDDVSSSSSSVVVIVVVVVSTVLSILGQLAGILVRMCLQSSSCD